MKQLYSRQNIMKFVLATAAFYALLSWNVFRVGEIIIPQEKDYIYKTSQAIFPEQQEWASGEHYAAPAEEIQEKKYELICQSNKTLCDKITFGEGIVPEEKYQYTAGIFLVGNFIDTYIVSQQKIENTLKKIDVKKDTKQRRGYATRDTIVLNTTEVGTKKEIIGLISHEIGHIIDLGMLQGREEEKNETFTEFGKAVFAGDDISLKYYGISRDNETIRKSSAIKKDFCSGYGMSDPFEDFAECINLYVHHNSMFQAFALENKVMRKKFNFIAGLFSGKYIAKGTKANTQERPWDTTKIN